MGIITKEVDVKLWSRHAQYYLNLGYCGKHGDIISVKVNDLPRRSKANVYVQCDFCGEKKYIQYADYLKSVEKYGLYSCNKCLHYKTECTNSIKYGVSNYSSTIECREKVKNSSIKNYGVTTPSKSDKIKEKIRMTNIHKYGVPYTQQSPEVRAKANETLCKNGNQKTSKQQLYLHSLFGGKLNYFVKYYAVDICFPEEKLAIEYDGGGHDLRVTLGRLTQEEFDQKEIIRNNIIKKEGYKQMRIVSSKDKLPSDTILLQMLSDAKSYFSQYPNHSWIEFNIDTSSVCNAECKEGIPYDFGSLRTIKDSDLNNDLSTTNNTAQAV